MNHGLTGYRHGCRCDVCRTEVSAYRRRLYWQGSAARSRADRTVDDVAVERARQGDRSVTLNGAEVAAAFAWLHGHGYSGRQIAKCLGVTDRTVFRWMSGRVRHPHGRPGRTGRDVA